MYAKTNIALVSVDGDLDVTTVPEVRRTIDRLVGDGCRRIVANMALASHVDSAGMGLILSELRRIRSTGGLLSLTNVSYAVYQVLARLRLLDLMPVARAGARREVEDLDPSVLPDWRTTVRVDASSLSSARERVTSLLSEMPFSADELFDLTLACGEALGNAVDHTCGDGVLVTVTAYPDRACVDVADCGCGFSLAANEEPPECGAGAERGRGIRLMRLLADAVTIAPKSAGSGTVVRLVKLFGTPASPAV